MSTNNKKGTASKALLEMDSIMESIKKESKSTLSTLLSEAVKDALRDSINDDEYEVVDGDNDSNSAEQVQDTESQEQPETTEDNTSEVPEDTTSDDDTEGTEEESEEGSGWDEFQQYKVGDDTYDLTGVEDNDTVVKVYKLLKDDDQVVIKNDGGKLELKDNETGAEYVIDLGDSSDDKEDEDTSDVESTEDNEAEQLSEGIFEIDLGDEGEGDEFAGFGDVNNMPEVEGGDQESEEGHDDFNDEDVDKLYADISDKPEHYHNGENGDGNEGMYFENKKTKKTMKESKNNKEVLFEIDLGYTDNYQKEDPIAGLSNNEPSKSGKTWHKGVPTGTEKPWAGSTQGKGEPFDKGVNECGNVVKEEGELDNVDNKQEEIVDEATNVGGAVQQRTSSKSHIPANRKEHGPKIKRHVSTEASYDEVVNEMKKMKKENKALQEAVIELRNGLKEAYLTNVNLGKITKLFLENTTTKAEKIDIINRFTNEAKTVEQSKTLFESISKQLRKAPGMEQITENKAGKTAEGSKVINESKVNKTKDIMEVIDFMNRMQKY